MPCIKATRTAVSPEHGLMPLPLPAVKTGSVRPVRRPGTSVGSMTEVHTFTSCAKPRAGDRVAPDLGGTARSGRIETKESQRCTNLRA